MKCKCQNHYHMTMGRIEKRDMLVVQFKNEVHASITIIDPDDTRDRHDFAWGWAVGKGLFPADAKEFAFHICHHTRIA